MRHPILIVFLVGGACKPAVPNNIPATAPCASPTEDVGLDMHNAAGVVGIGRSIRVVNLYWFDGWDAVANHVTKRMQMRNIDTATKALLSSQYFAHTCQYGAPSYTFDRGVDTSGLNPCPFADAPITHSPLFSDIETFLTCEEALPQTAVPVAGGLPSGLIPGAPSVCQLCGIGFPCYLDPPCRAAPNPTGDLLINLFVPDGYTPAVSECKPYHFQVPTWSLGWPFFPIPFTQARPIYYTVIPTSCYADVDAMMADVSHEMVEALTDEMPGAYWYTRHNNASVASDAEAADICEHLVATDGNDWQRGSNGSPLPQSFVGQLPWLDAGGAWRTMSLAPYWSNKDNMCIAPGESIAAAPTCNDTCNCSCPAGKSCKAGRCGPPPTCANQCQSNFAAALTNCNGDSACVCEARQQQLCCQLACEGRPCKRQRCN